MSNYLLDTHVVIWLMFDEKRIPPITLQEIKNPINEVYISAISFWEMSMKYQIGKLDLKIFLPSELPKIYLEQGYKSLPVSINESASYFQLSNNFHKDPFDRMLIWQAICNNFTFISNDGNMPPYVSDGLKLLW